MGALYEDVERFFGDIFAWYGRQVARIPWLFVIIPVLVCGLLGLGLFSLSYETEVEVLYTPIGSQAANDQDLLLRLFPDLTAEEFYSQQQITQPTFAEVIIVAKSDGFDNVDVDACLNNITSASVRREIRALNDVILNLTIPGDTELEWNTYSDVCALRGGRCVVDGLMFIENLTDTWTPNPSTDLNVGQSKDLSDNLECASDRWSLINLPVMSGYKTKNNSFCPNVIRLRYNLIHNNSLQRAHSLAWEKVFLTYMETFGSNVINVSYTVSESLDIELREHVGTDTRYLGFSVLAMLIFATIIGSGVNCVTNHLALAYAGVFTALLAVMGAFGLLSLLGLRFVNLSGVMPFMVLGIGADDMFQLLTEWRQSNIRDSTEDRMANTLRSTAVSLTITSLTDLIALCIGATSPFVSIRNFCAFSGVAVLLCYFNQLTLFSGCIVLHARRVQASRHWVTCCTTKSREEMEEDGAHPMLVFLCSGKPPIRIGEEGGICRRISKLLYTYYPQFLLHWATKCMVFVLFITYISISFWGACHIQKGLKLEWVVPNESYFSKYLHMDFKYFPNNGPIITFVARNTHRYSHELILYHRQDVQNEISSLLAKAEKMPVITNGSRLSWLENYLAFKRSQNLSVPLTEQDLIDDLLQNFLPQNPCFVEDIKFNDDFSLIEASRFYVVSRKLVNSEAESELMLQLRALANSSPLDVTAYSPNFIYYEHYVSILKNTCLPVGVTMIGLMFVALVFIPHPIAVTCVAVAMVSSVVGMIGFMKFWRLSLSAITVIQVIISLGICVSFTVQMSHGFMTATGKNRNERVTVAIEKVGIPILNGALSSLFCAVMLSFGSSFIFTSFFKTMILVFFIGIIHSLVFLPVMLSFIGPRRTSKPRVFVPVSPSSRSLQDTYRANALFYRSPNDNQDKRDDPDQRAENGATEQRDPELADLNVIPEENGAFENQAAEQNSFASREAELRRKVSFEGDHVPRGERTNVYNKDDDELEDAHSLTKKLTDDPEHPV